ncbi:MAG: glutamate racemase, partial [bacterium]|nr:glutamate racemase [bacterium]
CTHYPIIEKVIKKVLPGTDIINPGTVIAEELRDFLTKNDLLNNQRKIGKSGFYVTDLNRRFTKTAEMFLGKKLKGKIWRVDIE